MSECSFVNYCAPTLAGIKTGSLFSCDCTSKNELILEIRQYNKILVPKGLKLLPVRLQNNKALIYLYRPDMLKSDLNDSLAAYLLKSCGYNLENCNCCVVQLVKRLQENDNFPHEIGLFLGYPPEDVYGFIKNPRQGCKYTGTWKVYGDVYKAKQIFDSYNKCTKNYNNRLAMGHTIEQLIVSDL